MEQDDFFQLSFVKNPHDKYARYSLQIRELGLAFLNYALDETTRNLIDWDSLHLTNESYLDEELMAHYTDICYCGSMVTGIPFRIGLLIEHKSKPPEPGELTEQLGRYIFNARRDDQKKGSPLTLTIPIVLYHGKRHLRREKPGTIFPGAPEHLLQYVPDFRYIIVDLSATSDEEISAIGIPALQQFFMALKYSRDEKKMADFWLDFLKFAASVNGQIVYIRFAVVTARYLNTTSKTIQLKIQNMDNASASPEEKLFHSYLEDRFEQAREKGIKEGLQKGIKEGIKEGLQKGIKEGVKEGLETAIRKFLLKNPSWTDHQVADSFDVSIPLVAKIRKSIPG